MITWTIGAGGLLGSAIGRFSETPFTGSHVNWSDRAAASRILGEDLLRFRDHAGSDAWAIAWAAGAATVSTPRPGTVDELRVLTELLTQLRASAPRGPGAFFLTSSAGGAYAGSQGPPFQDGTTPVPVSPYGELKLAQEHAAHRVLSDVCPVVIGRVSNLYGPGQNMTKMQGLVSRLAIAAVTQQPLNVFVSLDTIRDYIYVDDAARIASHWIRDAVGRQTGGSQVRIIASGEAVTVGHLIRTMHLVTKRRIPIALGSHPSARDQVLDLRLSPSGRDQWADHALTPMPVGVKRVYLDILQRVQQTAPSYSGAG